MSRRQRSAREQAQRLRISRDKALRRRTRVRRAAGAAAAAVTLAGPGTVAQSPAQAQAATGHLAGAALSDCDGATTPGSSPSHLTDVGGDLYFTAFDSEHGEALWRTDGSSSGTVVLAEFASGGGYGYDDDYGYSSGPASLTDVGGTLFFTVDNDDSNELWRSDGTAAGTVRVKSFASLGEGYDDAAGSLTAVGDTLFFVADDGKHGDELWRSDGTKSGTVLVKDIGPVSNGGYDYYEGTPSNLTAAGDKLFFTADDGVHGAELWRSDGTKAGTVLVKNIRVGSYGSEARSFAAVGDDIYFTARDGVHGRELWTSDGTNPGTHLVKDIRPGGGTAVSAPVVATDDGTVFFAADAGTDGRALWRTDGTAAGTVRVKDFDTAGEDDYYGLDEMAAVGDTLFFAGSDTAHGRELWTSDGTSDGTVMVKDVRPGDYDGYPADLIADNGEVYFVARDGEHGPEVWHSDGTEAGTAMVADVDPDASRSRADALTVSGGTVYFTEDDSVHGEELWRTDGTAEGTDLVKDINTGGLFLVAKRGINNTEKGTIRVRIATDGAGTLSVARNRWVRGSSRDVPDQGSDGSRLSVTLEPTRAAKRVLRRTGELRVTAKFTFSSCGGAVNSTTRRYTLRMG